MSINWAAVWEKINKQWPATAKHHVAKTQKHVLVVPAYNEDLPTIRKMLGSVQDDGVRTILIVNESPDSSETGVKQNKLLVDQLAGDSLVKDGRLSVFHYKIPGTCGVGGARFVGCAFARHLQELREVELPLLHNTDSDSCLPAGFFEQTASACKPDTSVVFHSLGHHADDPKQDLESASLVRSMLLLCQLALSSMRSPWAFLTTGCGLSIPAWAYDGIGGWPRITVAEDIYFEGNLAKMGRVQRMPHLRVMTSTRGTSRGLPWPGPGASEEGAGHGAMIGAVDRGLRQLADDPAAEVDIVATSPNGWNAMRVVYDMIWGYLDGTYQGDQLEAAASSIKKLGIDPEVIPPEIVDLVICTSMGPLSYSIGQPGPERAVRFFNVFDQERQQRMIDSFYPYIERCEVTKCVNESPWGITHDGSWHNTALKLAKLEELHCSSDIGLAPLLPDDYVAPSEPEESK